jgi:hypothetical protein
MKPLISCCCLLLASSFVYAGECIDDFENGNADGWKEMVGDWEVQEGEYVQLGLGNNVQGVPHSIIQSPWEFSDGTIEVTIIYDKRSDGTEIPTILYRMTEDGDGYAFRVNNGDLQVGKFQDGVYENIRGDSFPIDIGRPVKIKIEVEGMFTKGYYDDVVKIRVGDLNEAFQKGKVGLAVFDANRPIYFDNVIITGQGIHPFPPLSQSVEPEEKLASTWGQIKKS